MASTALKTTSNPYMYSLQLEKSNINLHPSLEEAKCMYICDVPHQLK